MGSVEDLPGINVGGLGIYAFKYVDIVAILCLMAICISGGEVSRGDMSGGSFSNGLSLANVGISRPRPASAPKAIGPMVWAIGKWARRQ